tara:strand:- start:1303 stop:1947 length:645 start_codon:yes stop_codon:yes gene_type:complete
MNKKEASNILGGNLSDTSKLPSYSINLSALDCITGSKLVKIQGSVCYGCYALKGNYSRFKHPQKMQASNKAHNIKDERWSEAVAYLINNQGNKKDKDYFRWHDSGDLQSLEHLKKIVEVCKLTPNVKHWLPTREYKFVKDFLKNNVLPGNLTIRFSAHMIDTAASAVHGVQTSSVHKKTDIIGIECQSYKHNNKCNDCRLCWDKSIDNISYKYH